MDRQEIINRIKTRELALRKQGLAALYLFGSTARGEARPDSDVDLLFEVGSESFSVFDHARIEIELGDVLQRHVDLVPRETLRPRMRARVEAEMVQVF